MNTSQTIALNASPAGVFSLDEKGRFLYANPYCLSLLKYRENELAGLTIEKILTLPGRIFFQTHLYPLIKLEGKANEIFLNLRTSTGDDIPTVLNAVGINEENEVKIVCSFIPVFNRRKYEDEILHAKRLAEEAMSKNEELEAARGSLLDQQRALDKQISQLKFQNAELLQLNEIIAHDLQEPVRKLIFASSELHGISNTGAPEKMAVKIIDKAATRIKKLLKNLQEYLTLAVPVDLSSEVDLHKVIANEIGQLQAKYPQTNLVLTLGNLPTIKGSESQLSCMFCHLLKNAFDHGVKNNELHLDITAVITSENIFHQTEEHYEYADFVRITIADKGDGYDPQFSDYIFKVLKKLDTRPEHLGFGLAFCKRVAESHHGEIRAGSQPGKGACFTVLLPLQ